MGAIGSAIGGAIGTAVLPGVGTTIGAALGGAIGDKMNKGGEGAASSINAPGMAAGMGMVQMMRGKRMQKKADAMMPAMENPEERAAVNYFRRRKRAYQTGTANYAQSQALQRMMKTGMEKSMATSGGSKGLNMMSKMFQNAMLGIQDQNMRGEMNYAQLEQKGIQKLADRRLQLQLLKYNTAQARAAETVRGGRANMNAGLASMLGGGSVSEGTGADGSMLNTMSGGGGETASTGGTAAAN